MSDNWFDVDPFGNVYDRDGRKTDMQVNQGLDTFRRVTKEEIYDGGYIKDNHITRNDGTTVGPIRNDGRSNNGK